MIQRAGTFCKLPNNVECLKSSYIRSSKDIISIISNQAVLAVNQDALAQPGYRIWKRDVPSGGSLQLWKGQLSEG